MNNENFNGTKAVRILVSLLVAICIWVFVDDAGGYVVTVNAADIPVEFLGEATLADRGLMLLDDTESTFSLEISGTKKALMTLDTSKIRVQVDLTDVTAAGQQSVAVKARYPSGFDSSKVSMKPKDRSSFNISANVGELYRKSVEIRCDIQGAVADGYIAGELQFQPGTLEVRGQQSEVENISYARVTLVIDNATETVSETLDYRLYDDLGREVSGANIHPVTDQIQVLLPVYVIKELPLEVNFIESPGSSLDNVTYRIEPASIKVYGDAALLRDINSIKLDDFDLSSISSKSTFYYQIPLPDGCENLSSISRATMIIEFNDLVVDTLTTGQIAYENPPEGKEISILTNQIQVTLRGTSVDVGALTPEDVTVVADLRDVSSASGSYTVPAEVRLNSDGDIGVIGSYQIRINISDPVVPEEPEEPETGGEEDNSNQEQ
ncbi:CdaR family protein [Dysosmobacter sp.]|uniref:CdaR family protein n=1 Tax=Dysosmobacter sp. TaxID=2591382 RepID=UPI002A8690F5|nr:CdaR family protein [Dysosmobacter sp.]MDY3282383.1 CdaR family protein [Dysosmobacter sp.]